MYWLAEKIRSRSEFIQWVYIYLSAVKCFFPLRHIILLKINCVSHNTVENFSEKKHKAESKVGAIEAKNINYSSTR